jgi:hypothetical protein
MSMGNENPTKAPERESRPEPKTLTSMISDIASYRQYVNQMAEIADKTIILNRTPEHTAVIIAALLNHAKTRVNILSKQLSEDVYLNRDVINAAVGFLRDHPEAKLSILAENPVPNNHQFLAELPKEFRDRVSLKVLPKEVQAGHTFNFTVADGHSFRFEKDRDSREAFAQFGEDAIGNALDSIFAQLATAG